MSANYLANFIEKELQEALGFQEVEMLMRRGLKARNKSIEYIQAIVDNNSAGEAISQIEAIAHNYKKYFIKDPIDDKAIYNLKVYYLEYREGLFPKYALKKTIEDVQQLSAIIYNFIKPSVKKSLLVAKTEYYNQDLKFRKLNLPYTQNDPGDWLKIVNQLQQSDLYELLYDHIDMGLTVRNLDARIAPSYIELLKFDIEDVKSQLLWDLLGFIYVTIEKLQQAILTIEMLFYDLGDAHLIKTLLRNKGIINDTSWIGIPLSLKFVKNKSGLLALVDALNEKHYLKKEYSRPQQIRTFVKGFNLKPLSAAAERKKSEHHELLVDALKSIIPDRK